MEQAKYVLETLKEKHRQESISFYNDEKLIRNFEICMNLCKDEFTYMLCLQNNNSTKYALTSIRIDIPECSELKDFRDIVYFTTYEDNGEIKSLPSERIGVIPNYVYPIGNPTLFENKHIANKRGNHYSIELKIPFTMHCSKKDLSVCKNIKFEKR